MRDLLEERWETLTPREVEACKLLATGATTQHLANALGITRQTAKSYRKRVRRKLGSVAPF